MKPKYEFLPDLNWWVSWEQDPDDPFTYNSVKLSPTAVAELELEDMVSTRSAADVDACSDAELVSFALS
jgi:hypothetical protein